MIFNSTQVSHVRPSVNGSGVIPITFICCHKSLLEAKSMMKCKSTCWIATCLLYVYQYIYIYISSFSKSFYLSVMSVVKNILTYWKWYKIIKHNNIRMIYLTLPLYQFSHEFPCLRFVQCVWSQTSNISRALEGSKIVEHSDVVGVWPAHANPTTPIFST